MNNLGFVFPGQGSQYVGMGKSLYDEYNIAKETFEEASSVLNFDLKKLCFEGEMNELIKTSNVQPAILTVSVAAFRVLMEKLKLSPAFLSGHSLGEYSALTCAKAISFSDAIKIVKKRGQLMNDMVKNGLMLAVFNVSVENIESICKEATQEDEVVSIANYNSSVQTVISGHKNAIERANTLLKKINAKTILLKVSTSFHTPSMTLVALKLNEELRKYIYSDCKWPVISNTTGLPYTDKRCIIENLTNQTTAPVQWIKSIQYMVNQNIDTFVEIGPKNVLKKLIEDISKESTVYSIDKVDDLNIIKEANIEYKPNLLELIVLCIGTAVSTPNKNWNNNEYKRGVVVPYNEIVTMYQELVQMDKKPTMEQMEQALNMLKSVFDTKMVPKEIQTARFLDIFQKSNIKGVFQEFTIN